MSPSTEDRGATDGKKLPMRRRRKDQRVEIAQDIVERLGLLGGGGG
jgi:hypothetical protein